MDKKEEKVDNTKKVEEVKKQKVEEIQIMEVLMKEN